MHLNIGMSVTRSHHFVAGNPSLTQRTGALILSLRTRTGASSTACSSTSLVIVKQDYMDGLYNFTTQESAQRKRRALVRSSMTLTRFGLEADIRCSRLELSLGGCLSKVPPRRLCQKPMPLKVMLGCWTDFLQSLSLQPSGGS